MTQIRRAFAREGRHLLDPLPTVRQSLDGVRAQLRVVDARVRATIQERPLTALAAALALGFALRRMLQSRKR
jgi:hypothetical protein